MTSIAKPESKNSRLKPGPRGEVLVARDRDVMSPSLPRSYPLVIDHARGYEVWDVDGRRYLDFMTGIAVTSTGHSHPDVVQAIKDQADRYLHICLADFYYEPAIALAEQLDEIAPFEEPAGVFLTNSGAEAIEAAIKLARIATGKMQFIAFYGGFHGRTMGALSLTASKYRQKEGFFPLMPGVTHVPYPDPYRPLLNLDGFADIGQAVINYIEKVVFAGKVPAEEVAAIVIEPILGEGGYVVPPASFFPALRDLCDRYDILLIADEVQSGMGRTGEWWGIQNFGVEPDIITSAKGIASGLPLGAMIARKRLMTWEPGAHGSTFGGNPVSCAAALATLRLIEGEYRENAGSQGAYLLDNLQGFLDRHPVIGDIRGKGLMIGLEIVEDRATRKPGKRARDAIINQAFTHGLLLLGAGESAIRLMPPLMVDRYACDEALTILDKTISEVEASL